MRLLFSGLRTGILTQLLFLIIAAMLLVNVAMLNLSQNNLFKAKADAGILLIHALGLHIGHFIGATNQDLNSLFPDKEIEKDINDISTKGSYPNMVIIDAYGNSLLSSASGDNKNILLNLARISMQETEISVKYMGSAWGVFWLSKKEIAVSGPLIYRGRQIGGVAIGSSLEPVYQSLRESEKLVLLYIILDTIILALVGIYLLSRIVVKPIHRLLKMTERYRVEDIIPPMPEESGNEIGNLSRSLNIMLQRLDENKRELKQHISSLEKANKELKQAQDDIIRSEKFASVGRLSAGIAHEIGNPMGIILGYLDLFKKGNIAQEEKSDILHRIESEITRINLIIRQLLDFSRPSGEKKEEIPIHELITDTVNMLNPHPLMDGISLIQDFRAKRDIVMCNAGQLQQVFLNIIMNSADVLNDSPSAADMESNRIVITTDNKGDLIEITFTDNGPGIEEDRIQHIFDPFYTTKEPGKGTGLGLSVSYMIIEAHGGTIRADSPRTEGASIIINLPVHERQKQGDDK